MYSMNFFTSNRERRLWLWTLAVVVAIYSTLGLATMLAGVINRDLLAAIFVSGMLLIGIAVITQGLKVRPGIVEVGVLVGVWAVYLMVFQRIASPVERSHLIEYGVVGLLIYEALTERMHQRRRIYVIAPLAILITTLLGTLDECIQWFLPNRVFDPVDIMFNFSAGLMAVTARIALGWARSRRGWLT